MGWILQGALAALVLWRLVRGLARLFFEAPLPRRPWWRLVEPSLRAEVDARTAWACWDRPGAPWIARLLGAWASAGTMALQARHEQLRMRCVHAAEGLGNLARAAHWLGVALAVVSLASAMTPERGIEGLAAGRVEREALRDALRSVAFGVSTAWLAASAHRVFRRQSARLLDDMRWVRVRLEHVAEARSRGAGSTRSNGKCVEESVYSC